MKNRASQIRVESPDGEPWQHSPNRAVSDFSLQAVKDTHRCFRNAWVIWGPWFSSVYVVLSRKWGVEEKDSPPLLHSAPNTSLCEGHGGFAGRAPGLAMSKYLFPLTSGLQSQQKRELFFFVWNFMQICAETSFPQNFLPFLRYLKNAFKVFSCCDHGFLWWADQVAQDKHCVLDSAFSTHCNYVHSVGITISQQHSTLMSGP